MAMLETYEWSNFWWEHADDKNKKRILLIGDSITRAYLPHVNRFLEGEIYADMWASSRAVDHSDYFFDLEYVLNRESYSYDFVHFNNGLHGWHLAHKEYQLQVGKALQLIMNKLPNASIVLGLTTPVYKQPAFVIDIEKEKIINERNNAIKTLAVQYRLKINDLYNAMLGKKELFSDDGCHYNQEGEIQQAQMIIKCMEDGVS